MDFQKLLSAFVVAKEVTAAVLFARGYLRSPDASLAELIAAVIAYQKFHGLTPDGIVGRQTARSFELPRYCAADRLQLNVGGRVCRWPQPIVKWTCIARLVGWQHDQISGVIAAQFARIEAVCGLRFQQIDNPSQANILWTGAVIDGAGKVLADMQLPCGAFERSQCVGRIDQSERYVSSANPNPGQQDLDRVVLHEGLHGVGLPHRENRGANEPPTLMDPFVSEVRELGAWEVEYLRRLYPGAGKAGGGNETEKPSQPEAPKPEPPSPPPQAPPQTLVIAIPGAYVVERQ